MSESLIDQFIVGTLLGDSYVSTQFRFGFSHTSKQRDYFNHKVELLRKHGFTVRTHEYVSKEQLLNGNVIKPALVLRAYCTVSDVWKKLRPMWYPNKKKIVPSEIDITPVTLAYWYMDDGSVNKRTKFVDNRPGRHTRVGGPWVNQFRLHVDGFDTESQARLQQKLKDLGIDSWFYTKKSNQKRTLVITRLESKQRFKELVFPVVSTIPSMMYKIDYDTSFAVRD